jgi:hypothetical protein
MSWHWFIFLNLQPCFNSKYQIFTLRNSVVLCGSLCNSYITKLHKGDSKLHKEIANSNTIKESSVHQNKI